ncbi:hypothetical protein TTHERM_00842490 (macronuclear) [Tetrahymena thermophila SB210]|uniref:Calpain catalytic domain-containing protein n=1 Tax=Tetrahymena thermophila (strain SB210) TaxID=312017 RepID=I7M4H0_TETTS|nr:hypothetical protein TTHERM_00842490 [Tetrahymena thermophila SB210]EAS07023.2 hypothetical protein TTHERM_00842490 [Tetrahymena thermophila SB210]|eukprot:XP_001027265.2 hypothetical protein TTHERM_00842490 [Tetrahymena thermophila SB210]
MNQKTQTLIANSLGTQNENILSSSYQKSLQKTQTPPKSKRTLARMDSRQENDSSNYQEVFELQNNMNSRLYRNLANQAEIKKYTDRNKIYQITDEEIISKKINDEQGIIKKEFMMKQQEYKFKKDKYEDPEFKASDQPLGYKGNSNNFQWMRLHQLTQKKDLFPTEPYIFKDELNSNHPELDNLFQLYNVISRASHLAKRLFEHQKVNNLGIYGVWIFKNGKWKCIILDDYVLVKIDENTPCLYYPSKSVIKENLWLLILEKALAKAYEGYQNLKINELYNYLVEFTGSPYLLIRKKHKNAIQFQNNQEQIEREEKDFLWQKICSGVKKNYIIQAQCLETYRGIQKGNVYFVEFFYEFKQQLEVNKKILQMKNYRINQKVLDSQLNLTPQEMEILNKNKEDGVFFISFDEFYQNFDSFAIQRVELRDSHNSVKIKQENDQDISFFTIKLNNFEDTSGYISICQKDVQYFQNQGYSYSQFSLILAEVKPNGEIQYYSQTFSNDKMIHLPYNWKEGIYIIHVEVRWSQKIYKKFTISVSSNQDVGLQKYNYVQQQLNGELILSLIAKSYIEKMGNEIKSDSYMPKTKKGQLGIFYIYYFKNISPDFCSVKAQLESKENQEFIDLTIVDKNKIAFWLFPNEELILLLRIISSQNKSSTKFTFQTTNTSVPQNEPSFKKTLQNQLKQINIYEEFASLSDRKQNLLIDYFQQPATMEESEKSIEEEEEYKISLILILRHNNIMSQTKKDQFNNGDASFNNESQDQLVKLQKVQEYLSPQLSQNRDIINKCLEENTQKKQVKQPSGWNESTSRSDLQYTITSSKNFNKGSEMAQIPKQFDELESHNLNSDQIENQGQKQFLGNSSEGNEQTQNMTIEALTTCIYSSITKNKIQEMKIQELENIISHLHQQINGQSTNFANSIKLVGSSPNTATYQANFFENQLSTPTQGLHNNRMTTSQWQQNMYNSNARKSPCQRHQSKSKSPDIRQGLSKQNNNIQVNNYGTNEQVDQKNAYRSKSGEIYKDQIEASNKYQSQHRDQINQQNEQNYYIPSSSCAVIGNKNEQTLSPSPIKSKSQINFQGGDSLHNSNNIVQIEYLSKVKFLEEAIEYKNKEIERLMVLTAASRRNNIHSLHNSKSPERKANQQNLNQSIESSQEDELRNSQIKLHGVIQDLEKRNNELENELFNLKCLVEEKDRDILKISQQIDNLKTCADNQINFIQINEDLEYRIKEKEINEQNLLVQLEQQSLMIKNMEIDQIKKLEEYKDLIQQIQLQNSQEISNLEREKQDMQLIINKLESFVQSDSAQNFNENEKKKRSSTKGDYDSQHYQQQINDKDKEIESLNEKIALQTQLIAKQRQAVETLKKEIIDLQKEHENRIKQLLQQSSNYVQEKAILHEQIRKLTIEKEEQIIASQNLIEDQQNQLLDIAKEREDIQKAKDEISQFKRLLNDDRIALEQQMNQVKISQDMLQREREQFELELQELKVNRSSLDRDRQIFERDRSDFENEIDHFNIQRNEFIQQQNQIEDYQQIILQKEETISYMKQQQAENKQAHEQLKIQIQAQIKSYEDAINTLQQENQQLMADRDQIIQERNEDYRESAEILDLKKQIMYEGLAKQELQHKLAELLKKKEVNEDLNKENQELKQTLELLKQKIKGMQNIDDDIKEYINTMCKEKNNLQDRHVAHLEEIKNLKLQLKSIALENKSLNLSLTNLKEEIKLHKNQQTDMMLDEKNKKSFLRVQLQKKLNVLNAQLETYIRTTLDLDEIYYILLFNQINSSPSTSPQKPSFTQQFMQTQQGSNSKLKKPEDQSFNQSTPSSQNQNQQRNFNQGVEIDEKTKNKIEQLNNKRKRDLDKVYQIMEDFISMISNIQQ